MKRKYLVIAGVVWILLVLGGLYYYNKPHRSTARLDADLTVNAVELYNQFQQNETQANKKYMDKIIEVKGKVTEIQQNGNVTSIQLDGGSSSGGINCSISGSINTSSLPAKGAIVAIKGRCSGFLMDVNLVDCVVEH